MPIPSPLHERTAPLCQSYQWKDWAGYLAVCRYEHSHEREYFAFRESAGLIDISPLFKYEVQGPDAADFLSRVMARDVTKLKEGRVTYGCWCDENGKVVDDGTVARLGPERFRVTSADPSLRWFSDLSRGFSITIEDVSARTGALALQGPRSRDILRTCSSKAEDLRFFGVTEDEINGVPVEISRTGYTGDLGYEIWVDSSNALAIWDVLIEAGRDYSLAPVGLDALDMVRIEAGFILMGVDYFSAPTQVLEARKSTPYEIGLGWTVQLDREPFVGQRALEREKERGSTWQLVGLELKWEELEQLYETQGLPPQLAPEASREALPVYLGGKQIGQATSHTWSPVLKKSIALASVKTEYATSGKNLQIEHTVEFARQRVSAKVVDTPFFNPERKRHP